MARMMKRDRETLQRMADGWRPLKAQLLDWMRLEKRGFIRLDWGPDDTPDADKMCWYITNKGRAALETDPSGQGGS